VSQANAALTSRTRLRLARLIVEDHWSPQVAAKMFMISPVTARKWAARLRREGPAGMTDRSSRPRSMPTKTPLPVVKQIAKRRWRGRLGPVQIAGEVGLPASTIHAVLVRCRLNLLSGIDPVTGEPIRRYEHDHSGSLIHVDVTKFGNIPDGGGWRFVGRVQGERNREVTAIRPQSRNHRYEPRLGTAFVYTVIDDHSRLA
jgi:transposase